MYSTRTYPVDCPHLVWEEFTDLHRDRPNINERLVELIAADVRQHADGLDESAEQQLEFVLGGADDGR
jgi:hypothetical protein